MGRLVGKVAIITGAGRGIGRAHALLFAREGARVLVNDADGECAAAVVAEIAGAGGEAAADTARVGTFESAEAVVAAATGRFGRLDVLVNNAGILRDRTILKMSADEWDDVLRVHLTGTFACLQAAARVMKAQGQGGRIVNTSSSSGLLGNFGQANYGAAKAGIHALTRIAALELGKHGITVNAIAPLAMTRMYEQIPDIDRGAAERALAPEKVSPLVAFLASDAAGEVSGTTFGVEGDEIFVYRMMTSHGETRIAGGPWTIDAIEGSMRRIVDW